MLQEKLSGPNASSLFFFRISLLAKVVCVCAAIASCAGTPLFVRNSSTMRIVVTIWQEQLCPAMAACTTSTVPTASACSVMADYQRTIQAFSILSVLSAAGAVAAAIYAESSSSAGNRKSVATMPLAAHSVALFMSLVCWSLQAAVFNRELCSGSPSLQALGFQYSASFALQLCVWLLQLIVLVYTLVIRA